MGQDDNVLYEVADGIATITINRPEVLNALDPATLDGIEAAIARLAESDTVRGGLIVGAGDKAFVAGADIEDLSTTTHPVDARGVAERGQAVFARIAACPKPVLGCINGFALGGGLELALACHFCYASRNAQVGLPEVSLGLIPGYGGTQRLARRVGRARATELIVTGKRIDAEEALRLGLVNQVFDTKEEMLAAAHKTLQTVAKRGPLAVRLALDSLARGSQLGLRSALEVEADLFGLALSSSDAAEGLKAFLEKRKPSFQGR